MNKDLARNRRVSLERYVRERVALSDRLVGCEEGGAWKRLTELVERTFDEEVFAEF